MNDTVVKENNYSGIYELDDLIRQIFADLDDLEIEPEKKKIKVYFYGKKNNVNGDKPLLYKGTRGFIFDENVFIELMNESLEQFILEQVGFGEYDKIRVAIKCYPLGIDTTKLIEKPVENIPADKPEPENNNLINEINNLKTQIINSKQHENTQLTMMKEFASLFNVIKQTDSGSDQTLKLLQLEQTKTQNLEDRILKLQNDRDEIIDKLRKNHKQEILDIEERHEKKIKELKKEFNDIIDEYKTEIDELDKENAKLQRRSSGNTFTNTLDKLLEYGGQMMRQPVNSTGLPYVQPQQPQSNIPETPVIDENKIKMLIEKYSGTLSIVKMLLEQNKSISDIKTELIKTGSNELNEIIQNKSFILQVLPNAEKFLNGLGFTLNQMQKLKELVSIL